MSKKKKTKTKTRTYKSESTSTRVVILLDRTGSMSDVKRETISGFNGYLDSIKDAPNTTVTVVQFDTMGIDTLCTGVTPEKCVRLNNDNYQPRAMTPLYDAMGRTIVSTQGSVKEEKVLFVTLTDGQENASSEWTSSKLKSLIKEREDKDKWTFVYIGMGPESWQATRDLAVGTQSVGNVMNIGKDAASLRGMYARAGGQTVSYASCLTKEVKKKFWDDDKDEEKS